MTNKSSHVVVTDLTISAHLLAPADATSTTNESRWRRIEKDINLHAGPDSAWLLVEEAREDELYTDTLVVIDAVVQTGEPDSGPDTVGASSWERRPCGLWVLRGKYKGDSRRTVTSADLLFGVDAIDPRPQWTLLSSPLQSEGAQHSVPAARLSIRHGQPQPRADHSWEKLVAREDGTFKIVQLADTHMVTGVGTCTDAIDAHGHPLPESEADPLTVKFIGEVLDAEKPDLVVFTGDQLHHNILDSQTALFKVVGPVVERAIPFVVVFGNHDDEGDYALSREAQMLLLQDIPFSLCHPGPVEVDGVGNYHLEILSRLSPHRPLASLYLVDSHGEIQSKARDPDYDCIKQSQIDWFTSTSQELRRVRERDNMDNRSHPYLSMAFMHIPLPEYADDNLTITSGGQGEPVMCPTVNSHFYQALENEGVAAVGCGHDHVNDYCGLIPQTGPRGDGKAARLGTWLCYGGSSGFGAYGSYGGTQYHRRARVWELETSTGRLKTWKSVEYSCERVDELVLVEDGIVIGPGT